MRTLTEYLEPTWEAIALQDEAARERFGELIAECEADLRPAGLIETALAASILRALWRLERNPRASEAEHARVENGIRRNISELRRLQTDRHIKAELTLDLPVLVTAKDVLKVVPAQPASAKLQNEPNLPDPKSGEAEHSPSAPRKGKPTQSTAIPNKGERKSAVPRNALCPCGSGQKHKRCCGRNAPPVYNFAA